MQKAGALRALPFAERAGVSAQASEQHPQQQREKRPCSAIFRACDCFGGRGRIRPPALLPHYPPRREDGHPLPLRFGKHDLQIFSQKKSRPCLHTAVYHTRRKRRLTAAVRLCKNGRHSRLDRDADAVLLVISLLYALTHSARSRSPAWRRQQAQFDLFCALFIL